MCTMIRAMCTSLWSCKYRLYRWSPPIAGCHSLTEVSLALLELLVENCLIWSFREDRTRRGTPAPSLERCYRPWITCTQRVSYTATSRSVLRGNGDRENVGNQEGGEARWGMEGNRNGEEHEGGRERGKNEERKEGERREKKRGEGE